jgi:hypothetical protein
VPFAGSLALSKVHDRDSQWQLARQRAVAVTLHNQTCNTDVPSYANPIFSPPFPQKCTKNPNPQSTKLVEGLDVFERAPSIVLCHLLAFCLSVVIVKNFHCLISPGHAYGSVRELIDLELFQLDALTISQIVEIDCGFSTAMALENL